VTLSVHFAKIIFQKSLKDVKANPDKLALYYYHMPLLRIHPASNTITKVMEHLQSQGKTEDRYENVQFEDTLQKREIKQRY